MVKVTERAPGKLYLAGEYAVVTPRYSAIGIAIDRYLSVTIEDSKEASFFSQSYTDYPIKWERVNNEFTLADESNQLVTDVVRTIERYVAEKNIALRSYTIHIESELDEADGRKYGLGSSGALTVALVKSLLAFYGISVDKLTVFKLAALSHLLNGNNGSFGDLAISTFGETVCYTNFERQDFNLSQPISELLNTHWPVLKIEAVNLPDKLQLVVGWTGVPVSTSTQVAKAYQNQALSKAEFLDKSESIVNDIVSNGNILNNIEKNRLLLQQLAQARHLLIETPTLTRFIDIVEHFGGKAKTSGSGGGDCGIGFFDHQIDQEQLNKQLENSGILRLPLNIAY